MGTTGTMRLRSDRSTQPGRAPRFRFQLKWRPPTGRRLARALGVVFLAASADAAAQVWVIVPSVSAELSLTDNVDLVPSASRRGDLVTTITPELRISEKGAHSVLAGTISLPTLLYARTTENNSVRPEVSLLGTMELYPRLLFIEGAVQVSQEYFSPFGPRPQNLINATDNRYTAQSYRVSPFIRGETGTRLAYELRNNNTWTKGNIADTSTSSGASTTTDDAYTNEIFANVTRPAEPLGWGFEFDRVDTRFTRQDPFLTQIARARAFWRPDPEWELSATSGYEDNQYPFEDFAGATYGVGGRWRPNALTSVEGRWEHRFFGASYLVSFDHRRPLSVWSFRATRDITSYPQQLANLSAGGDVNSLLNTLFASRLPDPAARQTFVDQFISQRGLPPTLGGPISLFSQQVTLEERLEASLGLVGARNSVVLRAFRLRSEPIGGEAGIAFAGALSTQIDNTQTGVNAAWTHMLTPLYTLGATAGWTRTVANDISGERSSEGTLQLVISARLSLLTSVYAGARYQRITSNLEDLVQESAAFVGINHTFR